MKKEKICYIFKKRFVKKHSNHNDYDKLRDHSHYAAKYRNAAHSICYLKYIIPKEISLVLANESNYDYHFIIKEQEKYFEGEFNHLGENTEKHKNISRTSNEQSLKDW